MLIWIQDGNPDPAQRKGAIHEENRMKVKGIKQGTYNKIKDKITVQ